MIAKTLHSPHFIPLLEGSEAVGGGGGPFRCKSSMNVRRRSSRSDLMQSNIKYRLSFSSTDTISFMWEGLDFNKFLVLYEKRKVRIGLIYATWPAFDSQRVFRIVFKKFTHFKWLNLYHGLPGRHKNVFCKSLLVLQFFIQIQNVAESGKMEKGDCFYNFSWIHSFNH